MPSRTVTCSTPSALRTRSVLIPAGGTAALTLSAENNTPASVTRLLMSANGTAGLAGLAGLVVVTMRVGNLYLTGGPVMQGLRGAATTEVAAEALVALLSRTALRSALPLVPGDDLVITLRNDNTAPRRVVLADNRGVVLQTAALMAFDRPFAPAPRTTLVTMRATVPANATDYRIEVPRSTLAGVITDFAVTTPAPLDLRLGFAVGKRQIIEPTYPEMLERAQDNTTAAGRFYREPMSVGQGETLYLVATNDTATARTVSFVGEMVHAEMFASAAGTDLATATK